jgi:glutamine amidotransferase
MTIGLIDYGAGNLHSAHNALTKIGAPCRIVNTPEDLQGIDRLVLPGVGACVDCVRQLKAQGLWTPLKQWLDEDRPYFGICIGYQILFDHSEEFEGAEGLGALSGNVVRFPHSELKVPHMGWNTLELEDRSDPLWTGLPANPYVYFVHSYYPQPKDPSVVSAWCHYGVRFAAAVRRGQLVATQFHPEKSQSIGLRILRNFALGTD